ncbi:Myblike DNAbinding domain-containing protein, partial [Borealophlyctis nickersoniae]
MFTAKYTLGLRTFARFGSGGLARRVFVTAKEVGAWDGPVSALGADFPPPLPVKEKRLWTREEDGAWNGAVAADGADFPPPVPVRKWRTWTREEDKVLLNEIETAKKEGRKPRFAPVGRLIGRSCEAVYQRWWLALDPGLHRGRWTSQEDEYLVQAVRAVTLSGRKPAWPQIARALNRSTASIRRRWEGSLDPALKHGPITEKERLYIANAVYGARLANKRPKWPKIAQALNRSPWHFMSHWNSQDPGLRKDKWKDGEDELIIREVEKNNGLCRPNWAAIGRMLNRSMSYVRTRYFEALDPSVRHGKWSKEEDQLLREQVMEDKKNDWSLIAKSLQRSPYGVKTRWMYVLNPDLKKGAWDENETHFLEQEIRKAAVLKPSWSGIGQ